MFTLKAVLPLLLALVALIKADLASACGFSAVVGSGFDTSFNAFLLFAFPADTSPEDTSSGTPLGVVSGVLTTVETPASFTLEDGTLAVSTSKLTAPLLTNHTKVIFTSGAGPASQFCAIASTAPAGGSAFPLIAVNGTSGDVFAICHNSVKFRPKSDKCKVIDIRIIV